MSSANFLHAYVLHSRPYRESSLLLDLFVAELGRVGAVQRGARRSRGSTTQLFQPLLVALGGNGELKTLQQAEPAGQLLPLGGMALLSGFYLNELLVRLLPRDMALPELFVAYVRSIGELSDGHEVEPVLRHFESALLGALGYGFAYDIDAGSGEPVRPDGQYVFLPEQGFVRAALSSHDAVSGAVLLALAQGRLDEPECRRVAKRVLRQALARHLGGKPLKSRELFGRPG